MSEFVNHSVQFRILCACVEYTFHLMCFFCSTTLVNTHRTDGSHRADQMANDFKYLARLFTRTATASTFGGTVCAEMYAMTSSTNGLMCGALFRIKNTGKNTVQWKPKHTMTSFTGWGESASITVNGNNQIGNRNCQGECRDRQDGLVSDFEGLP